MTTTTDRAQLEEVLHRGAEDGVITEDQAERLRGYAVGVRAPGSRARPVVVEAMGYLGGAIALAGSALVGAQYWGDLGTGWRSAVLGTGTVVLLAAGRAVPASSPGLGRRLRAALWLVSVGCFAGLIAVLGDGVLELGDRSLPLLVAACCAAYAAALWAAHRTVLQQVAMMVSLAVAAATAVHRGFDSADLPGLGVWGVGLAWVVLGGSGLLAPRRTALVLGSVTAVLGAMLTSGSDAGMILTLLTIVAVIAGSIVARDLVLLAVGACAAVANLPSAMTRWFPDSVAAAIALVVVGLGLVVVAVVIAVRGSARKRTSAGR